VQADPAHERHVCEHALRQSSRSRLHRLRQLLLPPQSLSHRSFVCSQVSRHAPSAVVQLAHVPAAASAEPSFPGVEASPDEAASLLAASDCASSPAAGSRSKMSKSFAHATIMLATSAPETNAEVARI
jgi:hypothetical protein